MYLYSMIILSHLLAVPTKGILRPDYIYIYIYIQYIHTYIYIYMYLLLSLILDSHHCFFVIFIYLFISYIGAWSLEVYETVGGS